MDGRIHSVVEIGSRMDALGLWRSLAAYNFGVKPRGTVFPYFCTILFGEQPPVKVRFLMLEGWQTLHDYVRLRVDRNFGFYMTPAEMPHLELVILNGGEMKLFRHDPGYLPVEANETQRAFAARILWEAYGILLRLEGDRRLPLRFADEKSVFGRVEGVDGVWRDEPLPIPEPRPHVENYAFPMADVKAAKDLPMSAEDAVELDFRLLPGVMTREPRPRSVYGLKGLDVTTGRLFVDARVSASPESGLRGLWESMPVQVLKALVSRRRLPGEIRVLSGRVFRLLRPLCLELPFKLSLHDALPRLDAAFATPSGGGVGTEGYFENR